MSRTATHNWQKLFLEYNQGRYKSARQFAEAKGLNYDRLKKEFKKIKDAPKDDNRGIIGAENGGKKGQKKAPKKEKGQKENPWERLKKQFTDWPEEKLQAYLIKLDVRKADLETIPFEELSPAEVKELGRVRQERRAILSDPDPEVKCHAHNRDGSPCGNPVERGKKVCWNHGGAPGSGTHPGQQKALKHGLYSRFIPDDDEDAQAFMEDIETKSPLDILWEGIKQLSFNIARSARIAWVKDRNDLTEHLKRQKETSGLHSDGWEKEYEIQFAWDKNNSYLKTLASIEKALDSKIMRYEELIDKYKHRGMIEIGKS